LRDSIHKLVSPKTYGCNLCALTHGFFTEKKKWKNFREQNASVAMHFMYADEFKKDYASKFGYKFDFPIVLENTGQDLHVFISSEKLTAITSLDELIFVIKSRLRKG